MLIWHQCSLLLLALAAWGGVQDTQWSTILVVSAADPQLASQRQDGWELTSKRLLSNDGSLFPVPQLCGKLLGRQCPSWLSSKFNSNPERQLPIFISTSAGSSLPTHQGLLLDHLSPRQLAKFSATQWTATLPSPLVWILAREGFSLPSKFYSLNTLLQSSW